MILWAYHTLLIVVFYTVIAWAYADLAFDILIDNQYGVRKLLRTIWSLLTFGDAPWTVYAPFPYEPLPTTTSIRIIRLNPLARGALNSAESHLDMRVVDLEDCPEFAALSYTWGTQHLVTQFASGARKVLYRILSGHEPTISAFRELQHPEIGRRVWCNGERIEVGDNLDAALRELRKKMPGGWLWIDALCINQRDDQEKAIQINMMGRIYQSASTVVVWLGPANWAIRAGLKILHDFTVPENTLQYNPIAALFSSTQALHLEKARLDGRMPVIRRVIVPWMVVSLLARSWFARVWVVQEHCLATRVTYLFGSREVHPNTIKTAAEWLTNTVAAKDGEDMTARTWQQKTLYAFAPYVLNLAGAMQARENFIYGAQWSLLEWYQASGGRQATEKKDYIIGGLSLVRPDLLTIDPNLGTKEIPDLSRTTGNDGADYTILKSATEHQHSLLPHGLWSLLQAKAHVLEAEVYVNAAACLLTHETLGTVLRTAARHHTQHGLFGRMGLSELEDLALENLPSWVPTHESWMKPVTANLVPDGAPDPFNASKAPGGQRFDSKPIISSDGRLLTISAAKVDVINTAPIVTGSMLLTDQDVMRIAQLLVDMHKESQAINTDPASQSMDRTQVTNMADTSRPCLFQAMALALVSGHVAGKHVTGEAAAWWLCEFFMSNVGLIRYKANHQYGKVRKTRVELDVTATDQTPEQRAEAAAKYLERESELKKTINAAEDIIDELKLAYPHLLWPDWAAISTRKEEYDVEERLRATAEQQALFDQADGVGRMRRGAHKLRDVAFRPMRRQRYALDAGIKWRRIVSDGCRAFEERATALLESRSIFRTDGGRIVLAPKSVSRFAPEVSIMLVDDASTPFIFASEQGHLRAEAVRLKRMEVDNVECCRIHPRNPFSRLQLFAKLAGTERRLEALEAMGDSRDRWIIVGDAYLAGAMEGELADQTSFGRMVVA